MAYVGEYVGQWVGEWLGQALNPGAMYANLTGSGSLSAYFEEDNVGDGPRHRHVSPAYAKRLLESRLAAISASKPKKQPKKRKEIPAGIEKQTAEIVALEKSVLVEKAISEALELETQLDIEIKLEFAAIQIASQLALFEEEIIFMFMTATEA